MLHLILARVGGGKTTQVHNIIEDFLHANSQSAVLLVPEQYSFATERLMLERLGPARAGRVEVLSFSRLAQRLLGERGPRGKQLDAAAKLILMGLALEGVADKLLLYRKHAGRPGVIREMLHMAEECAQCGVCGADLLAAAEDMEETLLQSKLQDIGLILEAYHAQLAQGYMDDQDALTLLADRLPELPFFRDKLVVLDAFYGFTAQELAVLERILPQARAVYVTLCADSLDIAGEEDVFAHTKRTARKLIQIANKHNVPVAKPQYLSAGRDNDSYRRYEVEALAALEANLFDWFAEPYGGDCEAITLCRAADVADECRYVAVTAKKLVREQNLRCRDIYVIARDTQAYEAPLRAELNKCGLPIFEDKRQPVVAQPLMLLLRGALEIAARGFSTEALLRCLKTGLMGLDIEQVSLLENYAFLWKINGRRWLSPWTRHPEGFGFSMDGETKSRLEELNALRQRAVGPLLRFRESLRESADGEGFARAVFSLLEELEAAARLQILAEQLWHSEEPELALEQNRVWDTLMQLLDTFAQVLSGRPYAPARLRELFELTLSGMSLGAIPQGLDEICIGSADRVRAGAPKAVFVLGMNEGVFPPAPARSGTLDDRERKRLYDMGIALSTFGDYRVAEERFYVYTTLCCAREHLYLSCLQRGDGKGGALSPSEYYHRVKALFPGCRELDTEALDPLYFAEGLPLAFEQLAEQYQQGGPVAASLRALLSGQAAYAPKLAALDRAARRAEFQIQDTQTAQALFGEHMKLSASRVDAYYRCPFQYFCAYGLRAKPRKPAELDPLQRGSLLHFVLEFLFSQLQMEALQDMPREARLAAIRDAVERYRREQLDAVEGDEQLLALLERNARTLLELLNRLLAELRGSSFQPVDFELSIDFEGDIPPYRLELESGATVSLRGQVDRVDLAEIDGRRYVKIVDYKSSARSISLSDVLEGMNLQMLIYLFAICQNGRERYGDPLPAGILYQKLGAEPSAAERGQSPEDIQKKNRDATKAQGLLLRDSAVVLAMEPEGAGLYVPATLKGGKLSGSLIGLEELGVLQHKVDALIREMAERLRDGRIPALPVAGKNYDGVCQYCDYNDTCQHEADAPARTLRDRKQEVVLAELRIESGERRVERGTDTEYEEHGIPLG